MPYHCGMLAPYYTWSPKATHVTPELWSVQTDPFHSPSELLGQEGVSPCRIILSFVESRDTSQRIYGVCTLEKNEKENLSRSVALYNLHRGNSPVSPSHWLYSGMPCTGNSREQSWTQRLCEAWATVAGRGLGLVLG
jgi:hypothetical protein